MENKEDLAIERALAFYWALDNERWRALVSVAVVVILPILYIYQDGWIAGLWFLGASLAGFLISTEWKQTHFRVKVFSFDPEFNEKTEKHMKKFYSESKSLVVGTLTVVYILAMTFAFPGGNPGTKFPNEPVLMLLLSGFDALCVYFTIQGSDVMKAINLKKIAQTFNVPEQTLIGRIKPKLPPARPSFSITIAAVVIGTFGLPYLLAAVVEFGAIFTTLNIFGFVIHFDAFQAASTGIFFIILGGGSFLVAHGLRKMSGVAALCALCLCLLTSMFSSLVVLRPESFIHILPQPLYLHLIWLWGPQAAVAIGVWRNWRKMRWSEEMKYIFAPWELNQEKTEELKD